MAGRAPLVAKRGIGSQSWPSAKLAHGRPQQHWDRQAPLDRTCTRLTQTSNRRERLPNSSNCRRSIILLDDVGCSRTMRDGINIMFIQDAGRGRVCVTRLPHTLFSIGCFGSPGARGRSGLICVCFGLALRHSAKRSFLRASLEVDSSTLTAPSQVRSTISGKFAIIHQSPSHQSTTTAGCHKWPFTPRAHHPRCVLTTHCSQWTILGYPLGGLSNTICGRNKHACAGAKPEFQQLLSQLLQPAVNSIARLSRNAISRFWDPSFAARQRSRH
ncbi:hypothetical protein K491DRAFT_322408 [Lophiostoma macrostomum CBS 122681]|uniref:Uncharacterized protein n=1 Tax=Lophiostoma macrostomum CBS 122681 TaxID=1314788 RepID=A0A6A6SM28_9PLEO|nr:hypothetical protein K491DRAFT_322408 [Lophiostoma macrostomum CBS 122681]